MCALAAPILPTASKLRIEDANFIAVFDGQRWTVEWKWQTEEPQLSNQCAQYAVPPEHIKEYETELDQWVADGWLEPYDVLKHGKVDGVIPLMTASQPNKPQKV